MKKTVYLYKIYDVERKQDSVRVWAVDSIAAAFTFSKLYKSDKDIVFQRLKFTNICTFKIGNVKYLCKRVKA